MNIMDPVKLEKIDLWRWRIPSEQMQGMRVPGVLYCDERMLDTVIKDGVLRQVVNAAYLPGIVRASMAMPDIHLGYGLPIGGVVATDIEAGGVITPGGVGYDINCGVRLIRTDIRSKEIATGIGSLADALFSAVPSGVGSTGKIRAGGKQLKEIMKNGAKWAVENGYGKETDLENCEERGAIEKADPSKVSDRAFKRGSSQQGTLGSGNHFLEVQEVDEIYDSIAARAFGVEKGRLTIMIHTGSRALGHQVCSDYAAHMVKIAGKYGIKVPDRQLSCAPVKSSDGEDYLGAMRSAANYAWANRQIITHFVQKVFERSFGESAASLGMALVYDVAHNIAKIERHDIDGKEKTLCVHRKGATRALPPGSPELPLKYRPFGQPVIIPGDMGRYSYLLAGSPGGAETFYSTCHGAGRLMSRSAAVNATRGRSISEELAAKGISVRWKGRDTLREEAPDAYKDVEEVVNIVEKAGISRKIARMKPLAVIKG